MTEPAGATSPVRAPAGRAHWHIYWIGPRDGDCGDCGDFAATSLGEEVTAAGALRGIGLRCPPLYGGGIAEFLGKQNAYQREQTGATHESRCPARSSTRCKTW